MSIHVDDIRSYPEEMIAKRARRFGNRWCHLWCDPGEEALLHLFARRIGLARGWFQDRKGFPHYDVTPSKRVSAIAEGALQTDLRLWLAGQGKDSATMPIGLAQAPVQAELPIEVPIEIPWRPRR